VTIVSHPSEAMLLGYVSGNLPAGASLAVSAHLWMCKSCRAPVTQWETAGGAVLESLPEALLSSDALSRALTQLDAPDKPRVAPAVSQPEWLDLDLPPALKRVPIGRRLWLAPGIWKANVAAGSYLLRLGGRRKVPLHGHSAAEMVCVLKGSFSDASGHYTRGDFVEIDAAVDHRPVAGEGECICIVASEGPPKMRGWLGPLLRPFLRD
jgi:putative transcriptional regulator